MKTKNSPEDGASAPTPHTPGPWRIGTEDDLRHFTHDDDDIGVVAGDAVVAIIPVSFGCEDANARLIAAAPEMVAFIRRVAYEPIGAPNATHETAFNLLTDEARALLARIGTE